MSEYLVKWPSALKYHELRRNQDRSVYIKTMRASTHDGSPLETACGHTVPEGHQLFRTLPSGATDKDKCGQCFEPGKVKSTGPLSAQDSKSKPGRARLDEALSAKHLFD